MRQTQYEGLAGVVQNKSIIFYFFFFLEKLLVGDKNFSPSCGSDL